MTDMPPALPDIVIAGGGTAGWVAAAAFASQLNGLARIVLVESDEIGTVGVGESTIPTIRTFHNLLGIDERRFMAASQATFKLGISFEGWETPERRYFHAFGSVGRSVFMADFQHFWLEAAGRGFGGEYGDYSLESQAAAQGRFAAGAKSPLSYAYHLDATAYARFLRGLAEAAGVRRVEGRIERVERHDDGDIAALHLASGERVQGDVFVDCTGFRALLIGQTLGSDFVDWSEWLRADSAFAVQSAPSGAPVPYTRAIAHADGWRWRIPLQTRMGNGIVFSSKTLSADEARARLLGALDGEPLFEPRLLRFTSGMRREAWRNNCLALGLAAGFIEPLESTSIHLVMTAVTRFLQAFPFNGAAPAVRDRFNAQARAEWEHVRDFIILHYHLNRRPEAFWRECAAMRVPDTLAQRIAVFRDSAGAWQDQDEIFRTDSWVEVMLGQGEHPRAHHRLPSLLPDDQLRQSLGELSRGIAEQVRGLPSHKDFLDSYCPHQGSAAAA
ncbi:tryptophan halogenase family protein [Sphingomonas aracearum]|uniref:Tryptophan 7-halogenase n=1 Tax=Sphingomonas aracearum TaxID=2283317 RepID=A0A369VV04_9SPHN|nr:tryptophan halogenase family protein [Sphingomonas aracearum]RDE05689.1 tryptophan 7-halogenase [Sphingomonas aracearum]